MGTGRPDAVRAWATRHALTVGRSGTPHAEVASAGEVAAFDTGEGARWVNTLASTTLADGRVVVAAGFDTGSVVVWDLAGAVVLRAGHPDRGPVEGLAFCRFPDGRHRLGVVRVGEFMRELWDLKTGGAETFDWSGDPFWSTRLAAGELPDGRSLLAKGGSGGRVEVWDAATGVRLHTLPPAAANHERTELAFGRLADGTSVLAAVAGDGAVRLWDPATGAPRHTFRHGAGVSALAFGTLPGGRTVLATGSRAAVAIWDAATGERLHRLDLAADTGRESMAGLALVTLADSLVAAAVCDNDTARVVLLDVATGRRVGELPHPAGPLSLVPVFRPDGTTLLATGDASGVVRLWRLPSAGAPEPAAAAPPAPVRRSGPNPSPTITMISDPVDPPGSDNIVSATFFDLPDGQRLLATCEVDGSVRLRDPATGRELRALTGHTDRVWAAAVTTNPNGTTLLATAGNDGTAGIWNPITGQHLHTLTDNTGWVYSVALATLPDGTTLLATGSGDGTARIWNPSTGQYLRTLGNRGLVNPVALATLPDGTTLLAIGSGDGTAGIWNPSTGEHLHTVTGHTGEVQAVAFATLPDGTTVLATGSADATARIWNPSTGEHLHTLTGHTGEVRSVAFATLPDGTTLLATGSADGTVRFWNPGTGEHLYTATTADVWSVALVAEPDGTLLVLSAGNAYETRLLRLHVELPDRPSTWDIAADFEPVTLTGHTDLLWSVAFGTLPDGTRVLATGSNDGTARIWNAATGQLLHTLEHTGWLLAVAFAALPDGTSLLGTTDRNGTVRVWDAASGRPLRTFPGHRTSVWAAALTTRFDGTTLIATASYDRTARIWNAITGQHLHTLTGHNQMMSAVAFGTLPDGTTLLATGGHDNTARIWNATTGQQLHVLTGHTDRVVGVEFVTLPDGTTLLATGSWDDTARIWNATTGEHLHTLAGHTNRVSSVAFTTLPDGATLLATSSYFDHTIQIWDPISGAHLHTESAGRFSLVAVEPLGDDRIRLASGSGNDGIVLTLRVRVPRPTPSGAPPSAARWARPVPVAGLVALSEVDIGPPLALLADLVAMLGGEPPVDRRLVPLAEHAGVRRLRDLRWPADARVGLAALLLGDLPADERFRAPDADRGGLRGALLAALHTPAVPPVRPDPPVADLLTAAEGVGDQLMTLLAILGHRAVAADPSLPLRLRDRAGALPPMDPPRRAVFAQTVAVAERRRRADALRYTPSADGISRRGHVTHLLPTQLALPAGLFTARYAAGELLYRQYRNGAAAWPEPVTIVLDNTPATFGPPETVLRLVAHVITTTLWAGRRFPALVSLDRAEQATTLTTPEQLAAMWSARTLDPPSLDLALATAARHANAPVVVLTEQHAARAVGLRPRTGLRLLTTHVPGDPPRRAAAGPYHVHLPPGADPVALTSAVSRLLAVDPAER